MKTSHVMKFAVVCILVVHVAVRLYNVNKPVADWHSWRQADTAAVARNFVTYGIDILHPRYDDLSNIQSGKDNPHGWRMVEMPIYQALAASFYVVFKTFSIELWLRIISIASSAIASWALMILVYRRIDTVSALIVGIVSALLPYSVYYGRTILPDGIAAMLMVLSIYFLDTSCRSPKKSDMWYWVSAAVGACAILVKPFVVFFLPVHMYLMISHKEDIKLRGIRWAIYGCIMLFPFFWWRSWISQFPEGIPVNMWLLNDGNIRFKGAWFYWIFAERVSKLILGYWGIAFFIQGLVARVEKKEGWFFRWFAIGSLCYVSVVARGNVQHDYYQLLILPTILVFTAKGIRSFLYGQNRITSSLVVGTTGIFMLAFSWYTIRTYYWINRPEIVEAGIAADSLLPKDAKVIASYNGDTTFLYQIHRQGWPLGFDIEKKISQGATHYVTVSPSDADWETKTLAEQYTVLVRNEKFAIIDLTKRK